MSAQVLARPAVISNLGQGRDTFATSQLDMDKPLASPTGASDDAFRGRRRTREDENGDADDHGEGADNSAGPGSSKKRRRSRKGMDKKFECPHEGCGKSYSRAEHLYRHQLNRKLLLSFIS
jgi:hypothetical protein